jgi:hypothetical protein
MAGILVSGKLFLQRGNIGEELIWPFTFKRILSMFLPAMPAEGFDRRSRMGVYQMKRWLLVLLTCSSMGFFSVATSQSALAATGCSWQNYGAWSWSTTPDGKFSVEANFQVYKDPSTGNLCDQNGVENPGFSVMRAVGGYKNLTGSAQPLNCTPSCSYIKFLRGHNPEINVNTIYPNAVVAAHSTFYQWGGEVVLFGTIGRRV